MEIKGVGDEHVYPII